MLFGFHVFPTASIKTSAASRLLTDKEGRPFGSYSEASITDQDEAAVSRTNFSEITSAAGRVSLYRILFPTKVRQVFHKAFKYDQPCPPSFSRRRNHETFNRRVRPQYQCIQMASAQPGPRTALSGLWKAQIRRPRKMGQNSLCNKLGRC